MRLLMGMTVEDQERERHGGRVVAVWPGNGGVWVAWPDGTDTRYSAEAAARSLRPVGPSLSSIFSFGK